MSKPATSTDVVPLDPTRVQFFETFGFVVLPGLFAAEADRLSRGFDEVFAAEAQPFVMPSENRFHSTAHDEHADRLRLVVSPFVERSPDLAWLRSDPRILGIVESLLGPDATWADSDGNLMHCDVTWHIDAYGAAAGIPHIKIFFYLDPLTRDSGALRVVPGSGLTDGEYARRLRRLLLVPEAVTDTFGVEAPDIPAHVVETVPGDVIVSRFDSIHASFGGPPNRRLFTMNYAAAVPS